MFSSDASSSISNNKVTMAVKIMVVAAVDVAAKGAHWELVAVVHIKLNIAQELLTVHFDWMR